MSEVRSDASVPETSISRSATGAPGPRLVLDYCGELWTLAPGDSFTVGREADLVVDDNPFLHRRALEFRFADGFWWACNVGRRMSVTASGGAGSLQTLIGPGSRVPVVLPEMTVLFSAGETTYELLVRCDVPVFAVPPVAEDPDESGDMTLGAVTLTSSQFLLVLALAEHVLRRAGTGPSDLPSNARAAERLGWPLTTFNRKLDNVCDKFSQAGVKGLRGGRGRHATQRRLRLVEYAVAARIVRVEHLPLLEQDGTR